MKIVKFVFVIIKFVIFTVTCIHLYYWSPICQCYSDLKILQNSPLVITWKIFKSIALMIHPVGVTINYKKCNIILHSPLNVVLELLKILGKCRPKWELMCFKFKRNKNMRRLFSCDLNVFVILCKKQEKCEENLAIFRNKYLKKCWSDFLQFCMWSSIYVRQKIYKFRRNQLGSFGDTKGLIWQLCPVNNTFVCHTSSFVFLATDTLLCILNTCVPHIFFCFFGRVWLQNFYPTNLGNHISFTKLLFQWMFIHCAMMFHFILYWLLM